MSVKIRLRRVGRKKQPYYRVVVTDTSAPRDGQYLDTVGFYNPLTRPAELRMDLEKVDKWVSDGAGMSDTVTSLVRKARAGGDDKVTLKQPGEATAPIRQAPAAKKAEAPKAGAEAPKAEVEAPKAEAEAPEAEATEEPAAKVENAPEAAGDVPPADEAAQAAEAAEPAADEAEEK